MAGLDTLRQSIRDFLKLEIPTQPLPYTIEEDVQEPGYRRLLITYHGREGDQIPAYLLLPEGEGPFPGVIAHHQHNGERHWGKSEVAGLIGSPNQAYGPALARQGLAVLAPDSICFEDRRRNRRGIEPGVGDADILQHLNEMCYRLLEGDTLMRKVMDDASRGLSILFHHPKVDNRRLGTVGHSYGGNTVLFQAALDERLRFAASGGAACTFRYKMAYETGIEFAEVIPGFLEHFELTDLVRCVAPRAILLLSATEDKFSGDAPEIEAAARQTFAAMGVEENLQHARYEGEHPLTKEQFDFLIGWLVAQAKSK